MDNADSKDFDCHVAGACGLPIRICIRSVAPPPWKHHEVAPHRPIRLLFRVSAISSRFPTPRLAGWSTSPAHTPCGWWTRTRLARILRRGRVHDASRTGHPNRAWRYWHNGYRDHASRRWRGNMPGAEDDQRNSAWTGRRTSGGLGARFRPMEPDGGRWAFRDSPAGKF